MRPLFDATLDGLEPLAARALLDAGCGAGLALRLTADWAASSPGWTSRPLLEVHAAACGGRPAHAATIQALPYDDAA